MTPFLVRCLLLLFSVLLTAASTLPAGAYTPPDGRDRRIQYERTLEVFRKAFRNSPGDPDLRKKLVEGHVGLGLLLLEEQRYREAEEILRKGQEYDPDDARLLLYRGYALLMNGRYGEAEVELNEALALTEEGGHALGFLGKVYYDTGRMHQAVAAWERALELDPENQDVAGWLDRARRELAVEEAMDRQVAGNFSIAYADASQVELSGEVLDVLEEAYNEMGYRLGLYPDVRVPVLLYSRRDFAELTGSPEWAGGLYDGKIRVPLGGIKAMTPQLRALLYHEYTHVVVRYVTQGRAPLWLNEGLAEVAGRMFHEPELDALKDALDGGRLFAFRDLEGSVADRPRREVLLAYEQSYSFVHYLVRTFGWHKVSEVLVALGAGLNPAEAMGRAFGDFGLGFRELEREWRRWAAAHREDLSAAGRFQVPGPVV